MGIDLRWKKTSVRTNPSDEFWDGKEIGSSKVLQIRTTGLFGSDWEDVWTMSEYVYIDEKAPTKAIGMVEDYTVTNKVK